MGNILIWQLWTLTVVDDKLDSELGTYSCCIRLLIQVMLHTGYLSVATAENIYSEICTVKDEIMKEIRNCAIKIMLCK